MALTFAVVFLVASILAGTIAEETKQTAPGKTGKVAEETKQTAPEKTGKVPTEACLDRRDDCRDYGASGCVGRYTSWAKYNCPRFCGYCIKGSEPNVLTFELAKLSIVVSQLQTKMDVLKKQLDQQAIANAKRDSTFEAKLNALQQRDGVLQSQDQEMFGKVRAVSNDLWSFKQETGKMGNDLKALKEQVTNNVNKASTVSAFSVGLSHKVESSYIGRLPFGNVLYMNGYGFDSKTGIYTAQVKGLYAFHVTVRTYCRDCAAVVRIVANGKDMGQIWPGAPTRTENTASMSTVVALDKGQKVYVEKIRYNAILQKFPFSFFSGYLIKAM